MFLVFSMEQAHFKNDNDDNENDDQAENQGEDDNGDSDCNEDNNDDNEKDNNLKAGVVLQCCLNLEWRGLLSLCRHLI